MSDDFISALWQGTYDFDVFFALARDYFDDKKGPIRPTIQPMMDVKNQGGHLYYIEIGSIRLSTRRNKATLTEF